MTGCVDKSKNKFTFKTTSNHFEFFFSSSFESNCKVKINPSHVYQKSCSYFICRYTMCSYFFMDFFYQWTEHRLHPLPLCVGVEENFPFLRSSSSCHCERGDNKSDGIRLQLLGG